MLSATADYSVLESFEGFEDIREYPSNNTKGNLKVSEIRLALLLHLSVIYEGHLHARFGSGCQLYNIHSFTAPIPSHWGGSAMGV